MCSGATVTRSTDVNSSGCLAGWDWFDSSVSPVMISLFAKAAKG